MTWFRAISLSVIFLTIGLAGPVGFSDETPEYPMLDRYLGEELQSSTGRVARFSDPELDALRLRHQEGVLIDKNGTPLKDGDYLFVVQDRGANIFLASREMEIKGHADLYHSSLARGKPVNAAGHVTIRNGKIVRISNASGHYQPLLESLLRCLGYFGKHGQNLENAQFGPTYEPSFFANSSALDVPLPDLQAAMAMREENIAVALARTASAETAREAAALDAIAQLSPGQSAVPEDLLAIVRDSSHLFGPTEHVLATFPLIKLVKDGPAYQAVLTELTRRLSSQDPAIQASVITYLSEIKNPTPSSFNKLFQDLSRDVKSAQPLLSTLRPPVAGEPSQASCFRRILGFLLGD